MRRTGFFALGAFFGGLVSGLVVTLLAPSSGDETRSQITTYIQKMQNEVKEAGQKKRIELEQELARLRSSQSSH
jgi:gas vesicle protein